MNHPQLKRRLIRPSAAASPSISLPVFFVALFAIFAVLPGDAQTQRKTGPASTANAARKKAYRLRITPGDVVGVSLKAEKAKISEVAADLAKQLGTRVSLGPNLAKEKLTTSFADLTLEPALHLIAPRAYVDYEIRANAQPMILGILLMGYNDPEPSVNAFVRTNTESMMVEGDTEDTGEEESTTEDDPLHVVLDDENNHLSVKADKQQLATVVLTIAELLGVPAEVKPDPAELVDVNFKDIPLEDAIARLSPNLRLYIRADLNKSLRTPLRLAVVEPIAKVPESATNQ